MRNAYLVDKIRAAVPELSPARALTVARQLVAGIRRDLQSNGKVCIRGVGTLRVAQRAARARRNPRTGAAVVVPEAKVVRFRMSSGLKNVLNNDSPNESEPGAAHGK